MLKTCPCYNGMEENEAVVDYSRSKLAKVPQEIFAPGRVIEELYLDSNCIEILPKGVFNLPKLRVLSASDNNLCELSKFIGNLECLEKIDVSKNCISSFPDTIGACAQLAQIDGSVNPIAKLSDELASLSNLTHLALNETFLESLPENFGRLSRLKVLELRQNQLHSLPKSLYNLKELERLDIGDNKFFHLPVAIGYLSSLRELLADGNMIEEIPPVIGLLRNLMFLELSKNKLENLPPEIEALKLLTDLHLSMNELLELPDTIGALSNLETLKLDENDLIFLPSSIGRLQRLEELDVTTNNLEGLPCTIGLLTNLKVLTLDNNSIKSLPEELGDCTSISLLSLHNNDLITVPGSLGKLKNLQMINLSANMLTHLPLSFLALKSLRALWLSENQSKPVVPLQKKYNEKERKYVVSCYLLPQQSWVNDQLEDRDEEDDDTKSNSSIIEEKEESVQSKERQGVRTRGSISQFRASRSSRKSEESMEEQPTPWYEQKFIECVDDSDAFLDEDEIGDEDLSSEGSYNLTLRSISLEESFPSRHSFKEEQPSSLSQLPNELSSSCNSSCPDDQPINVTSLEHTGSEDIHSFFKGPSSSSSLLSSPLVSPSVSPATGAAGLSRGLGNHTDSNSLDDTPADTSNVYGNTSASSLPPHLPDCSVKENILADHRFAFPETDEENMRLRSKRHRNGIPLCQYEAFKPTRFNLYNNFNELSWATLAKETPDASSPTIKKKSVTSKDNPLIGARLARDESPLGRSSGDYHKHTANQKYEEKIRALQQQRLKERSRRKNSAARVEYRGEQRDFNPPKVTTASPPPFAEEYRDRSYSSIPQASPPCFVISDEGDSVAIKLSDFALTSPRSRSAKVTERRRSNPTEKHKSDATASGRKRHSESTPPVATNRFNGFVEQQQHTAASHYFNNTADRHPFSKDDSSLRPGSPGDVFVRSESNGRAVSPSVRTTEVPAERRGNGHRKYNVIDLTGNILQNDQSKTYDYQNSQSNDRVLFGDERNGGSRKGRAENWDSSRSFEVNVRAATPATTSEQKGNAKQSDTFTDNPANDRRRPARKLLLPSNDSVQHVTVKSRKINQPVSPRLMVVDERNSNQDVAFKEFSPNCKVEDVTSFLVNNLNNEVPMSTDQYDVDTINTTTAATTGRIIHQRVSVDCDVEDMTRNISKHLVEFCKVRNVETKKDGSQQSEIRVQVTDLDMPDAACPLTRSTLDAKKPNANEKQEKHNLQVVSIPNGPTEEIQVRVYRNPILGFSIGGGVNSGTDVNIQGIYVAAVNPDGPSSHLLKLGDRILEVNQLNLRSISHEHAVLFLTHNQQLDLLIERVRQL